MAETNGQPGQIHALTIGETYAVVPLTKGQYALIDVDDWEIIGKNRWCAQGPTSAGKYYAVRRQCGAAKKTTTLYMHRAILFPDGGPNVDHRSTNSLDNRRSNLRECTQKGNSANRGLTRRNTSGFKGVSWSHMTRKWEAYIHVDRRKWKLGYFQSAEDAARAYDAAAVVEFGDYARTNFNDAAVA